MNKSRPIMMRRPAGFTLIEAVMVIAITGILGAIVAVFIKGPIEGYLASTRRADLTDAADTALKRIARDVQTALPNSVRGPSPASSSCFEFLPVVGGGRYRNDYMGSCAAVPACGASSVSCGDKLDFACSDASFDVLANTNLPSFAGAAVYHAVIYNLGIPGADAYNVANKNRAQIKNTATAANIVLNAANQFPFESPGKRFQVIPDNSVAYSCVGNILYRTTQAISAAPLAVCPAAGTIVATNVDCANSSFTYTPAISQRNGLLTMTLTLTQSGESVRLYDEVHVDNVP